MRSYFIGNEYETGGVLIGTNTLTDVRGSVPADPHANTGKAT